MPPMAARRSMSAGRANGEISGRSVRSSARIPDIPRPTQFGYASKPTAHGCSGAHTGRMQSRSPLRPTSPRSAARTSPAGAHSKRPAMPMFFWSWPTDDRHPRLDRQQARRRLCGPALAFPRPGREPARNGRQDTAARGRGPGDQFPL